MADTKTYASRLNDEESLAELLKRHRQEGSEFWQPLWDEAARLQRFANQQHWPTTGRPTGDGSDSYQTKAPRLIFDRISPIVQAASGREIIQRFERGYLPRTERAARAAEVLTSLDHALMQATDDEQVTSAAFKDGPVIQNVSCVRWEPDILGEVGGGIKKTNVPIWQTMVDPEARAINYSDRAWHRYGSWWPQSEVKARWPDKYDELVGNIGASSWAPDEAHESSRIPWMGMAGNKPVQEYYPRGRCLWVEYEEWREVETQYEVGRPADPMMSYAEALRAGAMQDQATDPIEVVTMKTWKEVKEFREEHLGVHGEEVPKQYIVPKPRVVYKYAYQCGDLVLENGPSPTGYWTFQFLTGFRFPQPTKTVFKSLVSRLVDPQKWINVFMSALIRNLQVSPKGLLFVEEGFFRSRNEAMDAWARPGGLIVLPRGKLSGGAPGYKWETGGSSPYQGMVESLLQLYDNLLPQIAGFNPAALGQLGADLRRISGEVVRQVQDAAMTANAEMFDSLRLHRREGGRILLSFLRTPQFFNIEDVLKYVDEDDAYEVLTEPVMQPVTDPTTGQPQVGEDGQPMTRPAIDPTTGDMLMQPMLDPNTGEPMKRFALTPEMFEESFWKDISVEDVVPSGDEKQAFWKAVETSIQILLQPQPDTGRPVFASDDIAEMVPGLPVYVRQRALRRIKFYKAQMWQQQQQAAMQAQKGQGGGEQGGGYTNGSGGEEAAA